MTTQPVTMKPQAPALTKLKLLPFAFPFLRRARGKSEASARFTDEHEIHRLLAERESSGTYLVSGSGMWHGGIHITEAGAGQSLDLDAGLRCIADGVVIAFRANKTYPVSEIAAAGGESPVQAPYSTGFALVRHTMEFPQGNQLTFYSLYMHLMSLEDYANFPEREQPSYWSRQWTVTQHAQDKPSRGRNGQLPDPLQQGLRVRKVPDGTPIGILPQGASLTIGKKEKSHGQEWGQVTDVHGASLHPPQVGGYAEPSSAIGAWVYLGQQNGGPVVEEVIPDTIFDRVIVTTDQVCAKTDPQGNGGGMPIKAGELIGHLGRYDSLSQGVSGTRMAHIEVFCDDSIQSFLEGSRAWINEHSPHKEDWEAVGLPSDPTHLRIQPGTVLYQRTEDGEFISGTDPHLRKADVVQVHSLAELARDKGKKVTEQAVDKLCKWNVSWWRVESANALGHPIEGWVREFNHPGGGRVTREFAQKWIDFKCVEGAHDPAHTIFEKPQKWIDYKSGAQVADSAASSQLSPLMLTVYDALFTKGDGKQAADQLCTLAQTESGRYPWLTLAASRLIVKHESEWANPSKWKQLIAELEKKTGPEPQHEEELRRIENLAWWDEVRGRVPGFPGVGVFHIHPIGLVGNFSVSKFRFTMRMMQRLFSKAELADLQGLIDEFNAHIEFYKLDSPARRAHFFAQVMQETGASLALEERFVWKASSLISAFSYFRKNPEHAVSHGYEKIKPIKADGTRMGQANFEAIANGAYGGRSDLGNGPYDSGDGWRYRGRGMTQLTGRANYRELTNWSKAHQSEWPEDVLNFEEDPDLLMHPKYAARSAAFFWVTKKLPEIADRGATGDQVDAITRIVNLHADRDSYAARVANFEDIIASGDLN
jgi:predicted chitinase